MRMKKLTRCSLSKIILLLLTLYPYISSGQSDSLINMSTQDEMKYLVTKLRSGALLVRLKTRAKTIEQLQQMGDMKSAEKIRQQQFNENKFIMNCFVRYFDFCPVYFFYNTSNDSVRQNKLQHIFLDSNLIVNPAIQMKEKIFLIAEEGDIEISNQQNNSDTTVTEPLASYTIRSGGIRIMDSQFRLLQQPFPYFVKYGRFKEFGKAVTKLNRWLKRESDDSVY